MACSFRGCCNLRSSAGEILIPLPAAAVHQWPLASLIDRLVVCGAPILPG